MTHPNFKAFLADLTMAEAQPATAIAILALVQFRAMVLVALAQAITQAIARHLNFKVSEAILRIPTAGVPASDRRVNLRFTRLTVRTRKVIPALVASRVWGQRMRLQLKKEE
jgi:hypothetical protein